MKKSADSRNNSKFLDAYLLFRHVHLNPAILTAHNNNLIKVVLARYNQTIVDVKTFTFSAGSKSLSINNAVLGLIPKSLLFTMIRNADFIGSLDTNPYVFRHFDISDLSLFVTGKRENSEVIFIDMDNE